MDGFSSLISFHQLAPRKCGDQQAITNCLESQTTGSLTQLTNDHLFWRFLWLFCCASAPHLISIPGGSEDKVKNLLYQLEGNSLCSFYPGRAFCVLCRGAVRGNRGARDQRWETSEDLCSTRWGGGVDFQFLNQLRWTWEASTMCIRTSLGSTWTSWWRRRRAATTGAPCLDSSPKHTMDTMAGADETPWTPWTHPPSTSWPPWQEQISQRQAVLTLWCDQSADNDMN